MKKRYLYSLLFGVPGFLVSLLIAFSIFGSMAGFLWIYVFGDNPWPAPVEKMLPALFVLTFLILWISFTVLGFIAGKRLEEDSASSTKHIMIAASVTIVPIILISLYQLKAGNTGPKSGDIVCSEYCSRNGYSASGTPPKNSGEKSCSCYDSYGKEVMKVTIDGIILDKKE